MTMFIVLTILSIDIEDIYWLCSLLSCYNSRYLLYIVVMMSKPQGTNGVCKLNDEWNGWFEWVESLNGYMVLMDRWFWRTDSFNGLMAGMDR